MTDDCWLCSGTGGWEDPVSEQSIWCHLCHPAKAELGAVRTGTYGWYPSLWYQMPAKFCRGPRFQIDPWLLVIHSGAIGENVAEFFRDVGEVKYGSRWVPVNAHLNWSKRGEYVQSVRLDTVGKHCGGSRYQGNGKLNFCSIGIEMPGPAKGPRSHEQGEKLRQVVKQLVDCRPSLRVAVTHQDIDPRKGDPGPGFRWSWLDGLGLQLPFA